MQLKPHHPGWYWFPLVLNAYRHRDYRQAPELVLKVNVQQLMLAVSHAQLGELGAAANRPPVDGFGRFIGYTEVTRNGILGRTMLEWQAQS